MAKLIPVPAPILDYQRAANTRTQRLWITLPLCVLPLIFLALYLQLLFIPSSVMVRNALYARICLLLEHHTSLYVLVYLALAAAGINAMYAIAYCRKGPRPRPPTSHARSTA